MTDLQLPFGGEIWKQNRHPYMSRYIVTGVPSDRDDGVKYSHMAKSSDPRQIGNTLCDRADGRMTYTQQELAEHLHDLDYECEGQLYHILLGPKHIEELKSDEKRKHEWTGK
jgi:hypothetical protein